MKLLKKRLNFKKIRSILLPKSKTGRVFSFSLIFLLVLLISFQIWIYSSSYPKSRLKYSAEPSIKIYDNYNILLREFSGNESRFYTWVKLDSISPYLLKTTIISEDSDFFSHSGVNYSSLIRASKDNLFSGHIISGASTISMQLVRILHPRARNLKSKLIEVIEAKRIEKILSKEEILEQYLNRIPYGNGAIGIEAAARVYFQTSSKKLTLAQSAYLTVIPRSPKKYNPLKNHILIKKMQMKILNRMVKKSIITKNEFQQATSENINIKKYSPPFMAHHFTRYLKSTLRSKYPHHKFTKIKSTIRWILQKKIQKILKNNLSVLKGKNVTNGSVVVIDNETLEIICWIGSNDFYDKKNDGEVDGVLALRQPGSTLKPFTYAMALEKGYTASTIIPDIKTVFKMNNNNKFIPRNYKNKFYGPVRLRSALASSLNISAYRVANYVGYTNLYNRLKYLGFSNLTKNPHHYGLGLTMGNGETTLLQLTTAYSALANGGIYSKPAIFKEATLENGKIIKPETSISKRVFPNNISYLIYHILSDPLARMQGFGFNTPFNFPFKVAVKTGTSNNWRDNFTLGFTKKYSVGVWVGNFNGEPMNNVSGVTGAGPVFREIILHLMKNRGAREIKSRTPFVKVKICPLSGKIAKSYCPYTIEELYIPKTRPKHLCDFHKSHDIDTRNGLLAGKDCNRTFVKSKVFTVFPHIYLDWLKSKNYEEPPKKYSPKCVANDKNEFKPIITSPKNNTIFIIDPSRTDRFQAIQLKSIAGSHTDKVKWIIDNKLYKTVSYPFTTSWRLKKGTHTIKTKVNNIQSKTITIIVE
jgi:penicillin-binding protein 1C